MANILYPISIWLDAPWLIAAATASLLGVIGGIYWLATQAGSMIEHVQDRGEWR